MSSTLAVMSLFGSSFLSATLLPGNSEIVLVALLTNSSASPGLLVLAATLGNTLGGLTNVIIGRLLPALKPQRGLETALGWLKRFGPAALLLSWVPVVGDLLCVLAGWLRMPWGFVTLFLCIGKALRYIILTMITLQGIAWWH
ncbi:YqaA family protein [Serratia fonticola]|mgnify:CR=1 FL=1|uniref:Inner membrane protein yqaA n=1 Tax=Serratia fonticola TaxID=47917 RepID=A0A0F7D220_SERFO|nr:YqaA family protein [Serratia fonticola]AKG69970.1 membrane protein [Serratia fonticola]MBL5860868.1 DedA family protein [Serratia fonticola]CAI0729325.1 Inner membrane protein yqaA [Serratia fonticola]CAI0738154.1 Inner membrane protein yqaA [Serratia fonticola]CAI1233037.1 Inner membrane protein yqaA [Serratia fonticola]